MISGAMVAVFRYQRPITARILESRASIALAASQSGWKHRHPVCGTSPPCSGNAFACGKIEHRYRSIHMGRFSTRLSAIEGEENATASMFLKKVDAIRPKVQAAMNILDKDNAAQELGEKESVAMEPDLWNDAKKAQEVLQEINVLKRRLTFATNLETQFEDLAAAIDLLKTEDSDEMLEEAFGMLSSVQAVIDQWEIEKLLEGPFDKYAACISISAGAGGVDAQDWAEMLERMYIRWAERRNFKVRFIDRSVGETAGLKSTSFQIEGEFAFGYLTGEKGTHRLVRLSPYNAKALRQTSFAAVEVVPIIEDTVGQLEIDEKDLEIKTMRSGGKGGQNVNKVESAVRIKHIPTGLAVKCTEERSQSMNKAKALALLKSKLLVLEREKQDQEMQKIRGEVVIADFGQQIRNYVFHPYKMIKDVRTLCETSSVDRVLDGDFDDFIEAYLNYRASLNQPA